MNNEPGLLHRLIETTLEYQKTRRQARQAQAAVQPSASRRPALAAALRYFIPNGGTILVVILLIATQSVWARALSAPAAAVTSTGTIPYQGRLALTDGTPVNATTTMVFKIYSSPDLGATALWTELRSGTNSVVVSDGLFNVMLGSVTPIPQAVITGNDTLWLGVQVGTDAEMTPRVQLGSVPYAVQALTVPDGAITTAKIADGAITFPKLTNNLIQVFTATTPGSFQIPKSTVSVDIDTGYSLVPGLTLTVNVEKPSTIWVDFSGIGYNNVSFGGTFTAIFIDGQSVKSGSGSVLIGGCRTQIGDVGTAAEIYCTTANSVAKQLTVGSHTIEIKAHCDYWNNTTGTCIVWNGFMRALLLP